MAIKFKGLDDDFKAKLRRMQIEMLVAECRSRCWVQKKTLTLKK